MATWPSTLPNLSFTGYSLTAGSQVIRSDMDSGMARQRRRFSARIDKLEGMIEVTGAELVIFEDFVDDDCNGGASWFECPIADGNGVRLLECRIVNGDYKAVPLDAYNKIWNVTFKLEVRNR